MKTYEKMKAAIVDLSNVLDEALAFEEFKKTKLQPAFAGNAGGNIRMMNGVSQRPGSVRTGARPSPAGEDGINAFSDGDGNFVTIELS